MKGCTGRSTVINYSSGPLGGSKKETNFILNKEDFRIDLKEKRNQMFEG